MADEVENRDDQKPKGTRKSVNLAGFAIAFGFVWIVFDNVALALIFALLVAGGIEARQRSGNR